LEAIVVFMWFEGDVRDILLMKNFVGEGVFIRLAMRHATLPRKLI
jgi:hypothetical protein